jgi:hypothetical protein
MTPTPSRAYLGELDRDELVELIGRLADAVPGVDATLSTEVVAAGHRGAVDAAELARQVTASLPRSRFVDYRESYAVARAAEGVLDRLEELLDVGAADAVSKALLRATTRLRSILLHVDRAVELLSGGVEHIPYGSVIDRVLAAGRDAEALDWLDRAVAARRISTLQRNDYWILPNRAVEL